MMNRRMMLRALGGFCCHGSGMAAPAEVSVEVLGLLHPEILILAPARNDRVRVTSASRSWILEPASPLCVTRGQTPLVASAVAGGPAHFELAVPGVIRRQYYGTLSIDAEGDLLEPVIHMPIEVAVSSIVGAEMPVSAAPLAALGAQAIVARSFLAAGRKRHRHADFCDTTHCQFLRSPAASDSKADRAMRETAGLVLAAGSRVFPARYSAACGGVTEAANDDGFLYQRVVCDSCRRLGAGRRGHGFGLCQVGAMELARHGWTWQRILSKYFPGAALTRT